MHIIFKTVLLFSGLIAVAAARPTQSHSSAHPPHDADEEFPLSGHFRRDKPTPKELNEFFTESSEDFEHRIASLDHTPTKEELIEIFDGHDVAAPKEKQVNDDELGKCFSCFIPGATAWDGCYDLRRLALLSTQPRMRKQRHHVQLLGDRGNPSHTAV